MGEDRVLANLTRVQDVPDPVIAQLSKVLRPFLTRGSPQLLNSRIKASTRQILIYDTLTCGGVCRMEGTMQDDSPVYVPLVCPLSGTKIRNPVRAPGSNTYACFDKESFALSGRYTCPLTGVYCLVTELQRDEAMAAILAATPDDATFALVNAQASRSAAILSSLLCFPHPPTSCAQPILVQAVPSHLPAPHPRCPVFLGRFPCLMATRAIGPPCPGAECSPRKGEGGCPILARFGQNRHRRHRQNQGPVRVAPERLG